MNTFHEYQQQKEVILAKAREYDDHKYAKKSYSSNSSNGWSFWSIFDGKNNNSGGHKYQGSEPTTTARILLLLDGYLPHRWQFLKRYMAVRRCEATYR